MTWHPQDRWVVLNREQIRETAACPRCDARVGDECSDSPGASRERNHAERVKLANAIANRRPPS